jgi:hypothetical protein
MSRKAGAGGTTEKSSPGATAPQTSSRRAARCPGSPLLPEGDFPIAGGGAPPRRETTAERLAEYRDAGFTVPLPALEDPCPEAPERRRLDIASQVGLWAIVRDDRVHPMRDGARPGWEERVAAAVEAGGHQPASPGTSSPTSRGPTSGHGSRPSPRVSPRSTAATRPTRISRASAPPSAETGGRRIAPIGKGFSRFASRRSRSPGGPASRVATTLAPPA